MIINIKRTLYGIMLVLLSLFLFSGSVFAEHQRNTDGTPDYELPNNGGYDSNLNEGGYPDLVVGEGAYDAPHSRAYIYVKQGVTNFNLQIVRACDNFTSSEDVRGDRANTRFFLYNVNSITEYDNQDGTSTGSTTWAKTAQCNSDGHIYLTVNMTGARTTGNNSVTITNADGSKTTYIRVTIDAGVVDYVGSGDYENSFYYHIASPKSDAKIVYVNEDSLRDQTNQNAMTGIYNRDPTRDSGKDSNNSYWGTNIAFGPTCDLPSSGVDFNGSNRPNSTIGEVRTYDNDDNGYQDTRLISYTVYRKSRNPGSSWAVAPNYSVKAHHPGGTTVNDSTNVLRGGNNNDGTWLEVLMHENYTYRIKVENIYWRNSIQLTIPANPLRALDTCTDPTYWDYKPNSAPSLSVTSPKPNDSITVTAKVKNDGDGKGMNYEQRIQSRVGSGSWSTVGSIDSNVAGINAGSTGAQISKNYTVSGSAPHNQQICFRLRYDPGGGQSTPTMTETSGVEYSSETCTNVYNRRFNNVFNNDSITPNPIAPTTSTGTANFTIANTGSIPAGSTGYTSTTATLTASEPAGADYLTINSVNGTSGSSGTLATINRNNSRNVQVEFTLKDNLSPGDNVCIVLTFSPRSGYSDGSSTSGSRTRTTCVRVGEHAFLEVRNGSVWAGAGWADTGVIGGSVCNDFPATESYIRTHLDRPNDQGSFAEYAGVANGSITGFDTRSVGEDYFTFANTSTPHGLYAQNNKCITNYYEYLRKSGVGVTPRTNNDIELPSGQYFNDSTFTIGGGSKTIDNQVVYIVDGDVNINADILYSNYSTNDSSQMPFLMIVASGDITIHNQVQELSGVFISRGKIITCHIPSALTLSKCGNQLTVRGIFVAEDIEFRRTYGGILREGGPAEVFQFSPEVYLANPRLLSDYEDNFSTAQTKELPPLYR